MRLQVQRLLAGLAATVITICGLVVYPAETRAAGCPQSKIAENAGKALIKAAQAGSPVQFANALKNFANMDAIALFALGKHRKLLPAQRKAEFVTLTTSYVSRAFNDYRLKFRADTITPIDCNGETIKTQLNFLGGRPPQKVLWRMSGNKVADVNVQGVWLGQMLRKNYENVLSKDSSGIDALFAHIKGD